jgi:hypothetical protein
MIEFTVAGKSVDADGMTAAVEGTSNTSILRRRRIVRILLVGNPARGLYVSIAAATAHPRDCAFALLCRIRPYSVHLEEAVEVML